MGDPTATASPSYEGVWLTDRSRIDRGRTHCRRARYLEYHSGPYGYGIRRTAESLPLATGIGIHDLLAQIIQQRPDQDQLRGLIGKATAAYHARCARRGFLDLAAEQPELDGEALLQRAELLRVVGEQSALIEAIGWAAGLVWIPQLLDEYDPVLVEEEGLLDLGSQVMLMWRPDLILRRKIDGSLSQWDFKTAGGYLDSPFWTRQWEDNSQLLLTKIGVSRKLGEDVGFAYIFGIDKGRRSKEKASGLLRQWSPFLYAYHKPANPPMEEEDWQTRWERYDEFGKRHTLGKNYRREAVYAWPFPGLPEGMSSVEAWVRSLAPEEVAAQRQVLGPYSFIDYAAESVLRGVKAEELRWIDDLWEIHEAGEKAGWRESDPAFQAVLDERVAQSWHCHPFGKDCAFLPICRREPGWEDPVGSGRFEMRRPHHQPEVEQMKARGLELPPEQDEDDDIQGEE
jgi:hypothetical protein